MSTWEIVAFDALCSTKVFIINGKSARPEDFGASVDMDSKNAEDYGCGDRQFEAEPAREEVLAKYEITVDDYNRIAEELREKLSFGRCGWCV